MKFYVKYEVDANQPAGFFEFHRLPQHRHEVAERELVPMPGEMVSLGLVLRADETAPAQVAALEVKHRHFHEAVADATEVTVYVGFKIRTATAHR